MAAAANSGGMVGGVATAAALCADRDWRRWTATVYARRGRGGMVGAISVMRPVAGSNSYHSSPRRTGPALCPVHSSPARAQPAPHAPLALAGKTREAPL